MSIPSSQRTSLRQEVGDLVRLHRRARKLTQQELADQAGRSVEMINKIENGRAEPSFDTLLALSRVLKTPVRDFFGLGPETSGAVPLVNVIRRLADLDDVRRAEVVRVLRAMLDVSHPPQGDDVL